jgi:hypothetical protein
MYLAVVDALLPLDKEASGGSGASVTGTRTIRGRQQLLLQLRDSCAVLLCAACVCWSIGLFSRTEQNVRLKEVLGCSVTLHSPDFKSAFNHFQYHQEHSVPGDLLLADDLIHKIIKERSPGVH